MKDKKQYVRFKIDIPLPKDCELIGMALIEGHMLAIMKEALNNSIYKDIYSISYKEIYKRGLND